MVKIRLRRTGKRKQPSYRIVVADSRSPRDGRFIEILGHYNPLTEPSTVVLDEARALYWLREGAQPTDSVKRLMRRFGTMEKLEEVKAGATIEEVIAAAEAEKERLAAEEAEAAEAEAEPVEEEVAEAPEPEEEAAEEPVTEAAEPQEPAAEAPEPEEDVAEEPAAEVPEPPEAEVVEEVPAGEAEEEVAESVNGERDGEEVVPANVPLSELGLSTRVENVLEDAGLSTVAAILDKLEAGEDEALAIDGFGAKSLEEVQEKLREGGYLGG